MEDRILEHLSRRAARPEHLASSLGMSDGDPGFRAALDELEGKAWITRAAAWYGDDPSNAITIVTLTPEGRAEAKRRQKLSDAFDEPVILT